MLRSPDGAHPRTRGEHFVGDGIGGVAPGSSPHARGAPRTARHPAAVQGSSPHARGAHFLVRCVGEERGLIPARAGSTPSAIKKALTTRAHPRTRGEHDAPVTLATVTPGSSPHARGAPRHVDGCLEGLGLIPARAGSTRRPRCAGSRGRAHPRTRGEHLTDRGEHGVDIGLIPARAGSTRRRCRRGEPDRAHPRTRGEHPGRRG